METPSSNGTTTAGSASKSVSPAVDKRISVSVGPPSESIEPRRSSDSMNVSPALRQAVAPFSGEALQQRLNVVFLKHKIGSRKDIPKLQFSDSQALAMDVVEMVEHFIQLDHRALGVAGAVMNFNSTLHTPAADSLMDEHVSSSVRASRNPSPDPRTAPPGPTVLGAKMVVESATSSPGQSPANTQFDSVKRNVSTTYHRTFSMASAASVASVAPYPHIVQETFNVVQGVDGTTQNKVINDYTFLDELGRGSFGKVKLGHDNDGHLRAIKVIDRQLLDRHSSNYDRLRNEIAVMKKVNHRNLARLEEVINDDNHNKVYLVMKYYSRGQVVTLSPNMTCEPLPEETVKIYAKQLAAGLDVLHKNGIFHRDIKPDNILVDEDGTVCLSDFGVSAICRDESGVEGVEGTPYFMAPELCRGDENVIGEMVDLWALGVTLYLLAYGKLPFVGDTIMSTLRAIMNAELQFPHDRYSELNAILSRMLEKNPSERMKLRSLRRSHYIRSVVLPHETAKVESDEGSPGPETEGSASPGSTQGDKEDEDCVVKVSSADVSAAIRQDSDAAKQFFTHDEAQEKEIREIQKMRLTPSVQNLESIVASEHVLGSSYSVNPDAGSSMTGFSATDAMASSNNEGMVDVNPPAGVKFQPVPPPDSGATGSPRAKFGQKENGEKSRKDDEDGEERNPRSETTTPPNS